MRTFPLNVLELVFVLWPLDGNIFGVPCSSVSFYFFSIFLILAAIFSAQISFNFMLSHQISDGILLALAQIFGFLVKRNFSLGQNVSGHESPMPYK